MVPLVVRHNTSTSISLVASKSPTATHNQAALLTNYFGGLAGKVAWLLMAKYYLSLFALANEAKRFGLEPIASEVLIQLFRRFSVLKEVGKLPNFSPMDEKTFEDWIDVVVRKIKKDHPVLAAHEDGEGADITLAEILKELTLSGVESSDLDENDM